MSVNKQRISVDKCKERMCHSFCVIQTAITTYENKDKKLK